jgi:glycosyltransferase involved in cell wall biosynthesis
MKIAFSARGLSIRSGGARQFIQSLIPALAQCRGDDELLFYYSDRRFVGLAPDCQEIVIEASNKLWWDFVSLPAMLRKSRVDAAIFPKNVVPFLTGCTNYVVVHDLAYFMPELNAYRWTDTLYMRALLPQSMRRADGVFAVSENTKRDIIRYTGCDPSKITVTYEAADGRYRPVTDAESLRSVKEKYGLPELFVLYTGSLSPRKNMVRLLEAFAAIRAKVPHHLVLTGSKSWKDRSVHEMISRLRLTDRIRQLGYVEEEDMPALYSLASVYVYPSLYEGFGLPVLEAMQCGCPVVASSTSSIPEVAGDAAVLVDPRDSDAISRAIHTVLSDVQGRDERMALGVRRAAEFSWRRCAGTMLNVIRGKGRGAVLDSSGPGADR